MAKKNAALPEYLYVYREPDGDESFLMQWETLLEAAEAAEKGSLIGTYELVTKGKYKVNKDVEEV